jgi:glucan phosphoethanolaminetransferase (alkaline phosphatase superfamily)
VLVIGESSRRNRWQLFGYDRPTNPELSRTSNLVLLPRMLTSWPESVSAIPLILTRKPITSMSPDWKEASILRAMQEAGYSTWWISNQLPIGKYDSPVSSYAYEAQHVEWVNHASWTAPGSYDEDLIQPLRDALGDSDKDLFIVLHMMGSHGRYDYRYPPSFKRYVPVYSDHNSSEQAGIRLGNSYDNTILYTDHVLAQIISVLRDSNAITALWFLSDHGETLPTTTCDRAGHGVGSRYDFQVPALFWYSDAYAMQFPQRIANLKANAGKRTLSADTFESLIDMTGVTFPGHDETWSLFSPRWHYRPRIVNPIWQTDYDKAVFGKHCDIVLPPDDPAATP